MENKNIFIAIGVVVLVFGTVLIFYLIMDNQKKAVEQAQQQAQQQSNSSGGFNLGSLLKFII